MIKALRQPQLFRLWIGQAFSSIGDEIYRVGLAWFAVTLMGANVGYLTAGQVASLMLLSFVGGKWADHWHPLKTMISVDLLRAAIVLVPVVISFYRPPSLETLWIVALSLSALSAFFDPATQTVIPVLAKDRETIQSTNGLMATTIRLARMVGPAIVGLLSALIPMIHFFTLDALTFLASAGSVLTLRKFVPAHLKEPRMKRVSFIGAIRSGFQLAREKPGIEFIYFAKGLTGGCWNLALMIGFPLLIHDLTHGDARAFGLVMASYGVGNFLGSLYFGNRLTTRNYLMMFSGYALLGAGFIAIGFAPTILWIGVSAALAGFTGPMNDLAFIDMMQTSFALKDLTKMFSLRMALESASTLILTLNAPWMINTFGVRAVIVFSGAVWVLTGLWGLARPAVQDAPAGPSSSVFTQTAFSSSPF